MGLRMSSASVSEKHGKTGKKCSVPSVFTMREETRQGGKAVVKSTERVKKVRCVKGENKNKRPAKTRACKGNSEKKF